MKKKLFTLLTAATLVVGTSVTAFAAPKDDVISALKAANVPSTYVIKAQNYLKTHELTSAQSKAVIGQVDKVVALVKKENVTDLSKLSPEAKAQVMQAVNTAAKTVGVSDVISQNASGQYEIVLKDSTGEEVLAATASEVQMKKTGNDSFVLFFGTVMIILAGTSLVVAKRKVTA